MRFENKIWVVDWEEDIKKGTVINLRTEKEYYFSENIGLPGVIPQYIRKTAKDFIKETAEKKLFKTWIVGKRKIVLTEVDYFEGHNHWMLGVGMPEDKITPEEGLLSLAGKLYFGQDVYTMDEVLERVEEYKLQAAAGNIFG